MILIMHQKSSFFLIFLNNFSFIYSKFFNVIYQFEFNLKIFLEIYKQIIENGNNEDMDLGSFIIQKSVRDKTENKEKSGCSC